jgi:hypothetical protein
MEEETQMNSPSPISHTPLSESRTMLRERTFRIINLRPDFCDAITQLVIMAQQLHDERFTGTLSINLSQGTINNVKLTDSKKVIDTPL